MKYADRAAVRCAAVDMASKVQQSPTPAPELAALAMIMLLLCAVDSALEQLIDIATDRD